MVDVEVICSCESYSVESVDIFVACSCVELWAEGEAEVAWGSSHSEALPGQPHEVLVLSGRRENRHLRAQGK